ncbi:MAG: hypothetical protein ABW167_16090 [Baekduia sp.]
MPRLLAEISYQSAVQALSQQEAALNELRSRTGTLLTAEALTTSFLGAAAIEHGALELPGRLAIACFGVSLGIALFILVPWRDLRFSLSGPLLYEILRACGEDEEEVYRRAAHWLEALWLGNRAAIAHLYPLFTVSVAALALELLLWAAEVLDIL